MVVITLVVIPGMAPNVTVLPSEKTRRFPDQAHQERLLPRILSPSNFFIRAAFCSAKATLNTPPLQNTPGIVHAGSRAGKIVPVWGLIIWGKALYKDCIRVKLYIKIT
jgi:hypothetical protein